MEVALSPSAHANSPQLTAQFQPRTQTAQSKVFLSLNYIGVPSPHSQSELDSSRLSMRCPKSRFPIGVIVFDELELILFVNQGLTLSTGSLVYF